MFASSDGYGTDDFKSMWLMVYSIGAVTHHPDDDDLCIVSAGGVLYECMGTPDELVATIGNVEDDDEFEPRLLS